MTEPNDYNKQVIDEFRANGGTVGGPFTGFPLVLVHHTGAKSGKAYVNPLVYQRLDDNTVAIFASKGGAPTHPDWYYNLVAHPDTQIEIGTDSYDVRARIANSDERSRIWEAQKQAFPNFAEYEQKAGGREIPVVVLDKVT